MIKHRLIPNIDQIPRFQHWLSQCAPNAPSATARKHTAAAILIIPQIMPTKRELSATTNNRARFKPWHDRLIKKPQPHTHPYQLPLRMISRIAESSAASLNGLKS